MEILGIDIGGTGIKGALVDVEQGKLVTERFRLSTPASLMPEDVLPVVGEIVAHFDYQGPIGVGFPAVVVDGKPLTPFTAYHIEEWVGYDVASAIAELTGNPTRVINDADAAGIAENAFGAGLNASGTVILLTIGTGIGSAVFVDNKLVPNTEFGKVYLQDRKKVSEQYVSGLAREKRELSWDEWGPEFNQFLQHLEWLFTPQLFILGGGASKKFEKYDEHLTVNAKVVPAQLRNHAGIIGAAMAAPVAE